MNKLPCFLADECCDFGVVKALRKEGYDVKAVVEEMSGASDEEVSTKALLEGRVILTEDRDFGQMVFAGNAPCIGVIFIRFPPSQRKTLARSIINLTELLGDRLLGHFVVLQPGRIRIK